MREGQFFGNLLPALGSAELRAGTAQGLSDLTFPRQPLHGSAPCSVGRAELRAGADQLRSPWCSWQ